MSIWRRILQGVTVLVTSTGIGMVTGVVSAFLTFRYLTPDEYGRLALFISYYSTGTIFLNLGLDAVITSEVSRARGEQLWSWIRYLIRWYTSIIIGAGVFLLILFFVIGQTAENKALWQIMGVYLMLTAPNRILSILFHSTTRYRRLASLTIVRSVSRMIFLILLPFLWAGKQIIGIALIFPVVELVALITAVFLLRQAWQELSQPNKIEAPYRMQDLIELIKQQGVYAILSIPVKTIADQMPIWFLRLFLGETAVGFFAAAQRTYIFILSIFRTIETTLFPLVAEQMKQAPERLRVALRQAQKYSFWGGLLVIIATTITAEFIITLIAGIEYLQAVPIFRIIIWHLLLFSLSQAQRPVFFASRAQKWLFITYTIGTIIGLITYPFAIWQLGVVGSGIGFIVYNGSVILARTYITRVHIPEFYISPRTIFQIESFDIRLYQNITKRILGRK